MISFILDGQTVQGKEGEYVLQVAERYGVEIPTLCHHPALDPAGMCRLCTVRVSEGKWSRFVTACNYPIWEGMEIQTDNKDVHQIRKLIVELLYARCPEVKLLKELAAQYDIDEPRFSKEDDTCILCGLCTRICERMGNSAISLTGRGTEMYVGTPFQEQAEACLSCGACAENCPSGAMEIEDIRGERVLSLCGTILNCQKLVYCKECGEPYASPKHLDFVKKNSDETMAVDVERDLCPVCARSQSAERIAGQLWTV